MANTYFDNAATSFPKPRAVADYMSRYLNEIGGTYGRGSYPRVLESSGTVESVRELLARLLGTAYPERICFCSNATSAINTLLFGLELKDCQILISPMEHNAVMRSLTELSKRNNLTIGILPHGPDGMIDVEKIGPCLKSNTRLVIINHQSNVNGVIQPVGEIKERIGEISMLIDTAQSFGHSILALDSWGIEFAAFTGHKGLLGPMGTGGLYISKTEKVLPLFYGGTGSRSESYKMPEFLPDKFEAGTPNVAGIYGLLGAINDRPTPAHREQDFLNLLDEVDKLPFLKLHRAKDTHAQGLLFSISHIEQSCSKIAEKLYEMFSIEIRSGLHCAPLAHKTIGTFPSGTARFAPSIYHTPKDFEYLLEALHMLNKL